MKTPIERVALSWDFRLELGNSEPKSVAVDARLDRSSIVKDIGPDLLVGEHWLEDGILFQLVQAGIHGADYRISAIVERKDGLVFEKVSILPVRDA